MRAKVLFLIAACAFALQAASAADVSKPLSSETILVARVVITPEVDNAFYAKYLDLKSRTIKPRSAKAAAAAAAAAPSPTTIDIYGKFGFITPGFDTGEEGGTWAIKFKTPKNRKLQLQAFRAKLGGTPLLSVALPFMTEITIPEGSNYAYLGTIVFERSGDRFELTGVKVLDEFDTAQSFVAKYYGPEAKLFRVPPFQLADPEKAK